MTRQDGPRYNDEYLRQGSPANSAVGATAPATIATPTTTAVIPYVVLT